VTSWTMFLEGQLLHSFGLCF